MFSLKPGSLKQYKSEFIKLLCEVNESTYILSAYVDHAYEDSTYNDIDDKDELALKLNLDLEEFGKDIFVYKVVDIKSNSGWPFVMVRNTKPMTVKQFITVIDEIYFDLGFDYILSDCLNEFDVVHECS